MSENIKIEQLDEPEELPNYTVAVSDFNEVCRTCLSRDNPLKSFNEVMHNYSEDILNIIGVDMSNSIYLPQNICVNCINDLEHMKKFTNRSRDIHNYLYNLVECTIKTESSIVLNDFEKECNEQMESNDTVSQQLVPDQIFIPERKDEEWYNEEAAHCEEEDPFSSTSNIDTNRKAKRKKKDTQEQTDNIKFGVSSKGHKTVLYRNFEYIKVRENKNGEIYWRCKMYQSKCKARLKTLEDKVVCTNQEEHTHQANLSTALARLAVAEMKGKICATSASSAEVVGIVSSQLSDNVLQALPKRASLARSLQRYRKAAQISNDDVATLPPPPPPPPCNNNFDDLTNF